MNKIIGVLLSPKKWKLLINNEPDKETEAYIQKANQLNLRLLFFSLDEVNLQYLTTNGMVLENKDLKYQLNLPIPKIIIKPKPLFKRTLIRKWRALQLDNDFTIINEQQILKEKYLLEMLQANPDFHHFLPTTTIDKTFSYMCWSQLNSELNWEITAQYSQLPTENFTSWEEAILLQFPNFDAKKGSAIINHLTDMIIELLNYIHQYYPGIYELGFCFKLNDKGAPYIHSIVSKNQVYKDIYQIDLNLWTTLITKPIDLAHLYLQSEAINSD